MKQKINPPFLFKIFTLLMIISIFLPLNKAIELPYNLVGLIVFIFGAYVAISTKKMFKRTETPMSPKATPLKLHTEGIFNYSRNPMYLGIVIGLLGIAILTGILINLLFPVVYIILMDVFFIKYEEENLQNKFGEKYRKYKENTKRWI